MGVSLSLCVLLESLAEQAVSGGIALTRRLKTSANSLPIQKFCLAVPEVKQMEVLVLCGREKPWILACSLCIHLSTECVPIRQLV